MLSCLFDFWMFDPMVWCLNYRPQSSQRKSVLALASPANRWEAQFHLFFGRCAPKVPRFGLTMQYGVATPWNPMATRVHINIKNPLLRHNCPEQKSAEMYSKGFSFASGSRCLRSSVAGLGERWGFAHDSSAGFSVGDWSFGENVRTGITSGSIAEWRLGHAENCRGR